MQRYAYHLHIFSGWAVFELDVDSKKTGTVQLFCDQREDKDKKIYCHR